MEAYKFISEFISTVGFPIFISIFLIVYIRRAVEELSIEVRLLRRAIETDNRGLLFSQSEEEQARARRNRS